MKWRKNTFGPFSFEEYILQVETFHGFAAPGLLVGGFMVNKAKKQIPQGVLYEALCETEKCLPDAIQLLTPCTVGNGRLRIVSMGRFALSFFNKDTGAGVRVFPDPDKLEDWTELEAWYMKRKTKEEQDINFLISQIRQAGEEILAQQPIQIKPEFIKKTKQGPRTICPGCGETYSATTGSFCLACQGDGPYEWLEDKGKKIRMTGGWSRSI
jgi:formylmethanofuran dehydrogenase subunit E